MLLQVPILWLHVKLKAAVATFRHGQTPGSTPGQAQEDAPQV